MRYFLILFVLLNTTLSYPQKETLNSILKNVEKYYYQTKEYSYTSHYKLYENENSNKVIEQKQGFILRKKGVNYQNLDNIESLSFKEVNLVINNIDKTIQITKNDNSNSVLDLNHYLSSFPIKKMFNNDLFWICELTVSKGMVSQYKKIKIYINKSDYSIHKQVFYFYVNQEIEKNKKKIKLNSPRLEIVLKKAKPNLKHHLELVKQENYFTIQNNKINLSNRLKKYKLITL